LTNNTTNNTNMTKLATTLLSLLAALTVTAGELEWQTDAAKAQAQAKAEGKLALLNFTGSDWCPWCIKLKKEVFSTSEFAEYAKKNLVLVEVDFPRKKKLSDAQKSTNRALEGKYGARGYPTIILLDGDGKKLAQLGYEDGVEDKQQSDPRKLVAQPATFIAAIEKAKRKS
jgi:thioredoxin-related protein